MTKLALVLPLLFLACAPPKPQSPYLRVTEDGGRIYYADARNLLRSETGGFLSFRDLVTNEKVRLTNGTYTAEYVPFSEVQVRRNEHMYQPSKLPRVDDGTEPR